MPRQEKNVDLYKPNVLKHCSCHDEAVRMCAHTPIDLNKSKRANNEHFRNMEYKKVKTNKEKMKQQKRKPTKLSIDK